MKFSCLTRFLTIMLTFSLVSTCSMLTAFAEESPTDFSLSEADLAVADQVYTAPERTPVDFFEMSYPLFDEIYTDAVLREMEELCDAPGNLARLQELFDEVVDQYERLMTDYALLEIAYDSDNTNKQVEAAYNSINVKNAEISDRMCLTLECVLQSPYGDAMAVYMNDAELAETLLEYDAIDDTAYALLQESSDIETEYYRLAYSDAPDAESQLYALYLRRLDNMIAIAEYDGYDSYAEEAYKAYARDYTPADLDALRSFVKEFVVPYFYDFNSAFYNSRGYYDFFNEQTEEEIFDLFRPYLCNVSKNAAEAFRELEMFHLHDMGKSDTKNDRGYTISLPYYNAYFIFDSPYGQASDAMTLVHEFGHYYAGWMDKTPSFYEETDLDLAEVQSQGMEMLILPFLQEIFGERLGLTMEYDSIYSMLYSIIEGCLQDELQLRALNARMDGKLQTADDMAKLAKEVYSEYYGEYYVNARSLWRNWCYIPHTFTSPFYYISYAVSATAALGIFALESEDYLYAKTIYIALAEGSQEGPFCKTLASAGLPDPLTEEGLAQIERDLTTCFDRLLYGKSLASRIPSDAA